MFKERLCKQQPIAYQTLENALCQDRLAHAYMFNGPSGTGKKEAAYLLAQSILCDAEGFACESCAICQRVLHDEYSDMIYLDGSTKAIKKEDIMKLQSAFSKTGLEGKGKKIYILDHAENATVDALNSLLKFLEEPNSDMWRRWIVCCLRLYHAVRSFLLLPWEVMSVTTRLRRRLMI